MYNVLIFGTGGLAQFLVKYKKDNVNILAYLNSFEHGGSIDGIPIVNVDEVKKYNFDYCVITFSDIEKGKNILLHNGVDEEKIVGYHYNGAYIYEDNIYQKACEEYLREKMCTKFFEKLFDLPEKRYYLCSMNLVEERDIIESDFVREQTLALLSEEVKRKKLGGSVAELGVFRGMFAKKINKLFPDRALYLFDTFEGFANDDVKNDSSISEVVKLERFKDTSEELVLSKMPYPDSCIIKKGYFPDTFDLEDEKFCFVSIDADLYGPIKAGIEVFYPRLLPGGYIMVHDYNNLLFQGTKVAVQEYCDKNNISYVPISDMAGSIVITK